MTVTEHLMRPGTFNIRFRPEVPVTITDQIVEAMEGAGGAGCHIVVTPQQIDIGGWPVDAVLAAASYTGRVTRRPSRLSVEGVGILDWLNTYPTNGAARTAGTPTQWVGDLVDNGITAGTVTNTGATNVTRNFPSYLATKRELLDAVAASGGWEYVVRPDFTIDAAISATLFTSFDDPDLVVTRRSEGPDVSLRGVEGGLLDQELDDSQIATQMIVLAEGNGSAIAVGSDTQTRSLRTWDGSVTTLVATVSSPGTPEADADGIATAALGFRSQRRKVNVSSQTYALHRFARPGDYVWLYDPASGLVDLTNFVNFRGETITPAKVRLLSWSWPIESGVGVYLLLNGTTPTLVDLSDHVEYETGDTFWTVGDWNPAGYGRVNRTHPEIEERVSPAVGAGCAEDTFSHSTSGSYATISFDTVVSDPGGWFDVGGSNPTRITPGVTGLFLLHYSVTMNSGMTDDRFAGQFLINGTLDRVLWDWESTTVANPDVSGTAPLTLTASTDYVEIAIFQDSGGTVAGSARVALQRIG